MWRPFVFACTVLAVCAGSPCLAQEVAEVDSWTVSHLPPGLTLEADETVLRLTSGEWVKGELIYIEDSNVSLEGSKSADKVYDVEDILELHSRQFFQYTFGDDSQVDSRRVSMGLAGPIVLIDQDGQRHEYRRGQLFTAYPVSEENEPILQRWRGNISLGLTATFGNTQTTTLLGTASLIQQTGDWRFTVEGQVSQGKQSGEETDKSRNGQAQVDYDLNVRVYLTLGYGEATYDKFQNIRLRVRAGSGGGVYLIRRFKMHWTGEATLTGSYTRYRRVTAGEQAHETGAELRLATRFWSEFLDDDLSVDVLYETFLGLRDIRDTTHTVRLTVGYEIVKDFTINLTAIYERNESPERLSDGSQPQRDDLQVSVGFGWKL